MWTLEADKKNWAGPGASVDLRREGWSWATLSQTARALGAAG